MPSLPTDSMMLVMYYNIPGRSGGIVMILNFARHSPKYHNTVFMVIERKLKKFRF